MNDDHPQQQPAELPGLKQGGSNSAFLGAVNWDHVAILYRREMRAAFRERTIVINSILLPVLLYPFILWIAFTAILFIQGQTEGMVSRIAAANWPEGHAALRRTFELHQKVQIVKNLGPQDDLERLVRQGQVDLALRFQEPTNAAGGVTNFDAVLISNESREASLKARDLAIQIVNDYRQSWLKREAIRRGISAGEWEQFTVTTQNVASPKQVGGFILGLILPILFVVMVAMGCFFPAVDCTAGERERNTWETLMGTAASRISIIVAKYLYVGTLGGLAGVLNLTAMLITVKPLFAPLLAKAGESIVFSLPWIAIPVLLLGAALLAAFVAAGMMIFAAFAKTFKEGQAMITPFYLVVLLPLMFLQVPGLKFTLPLALIPVVNVTMMVRSAISGEFPPVAIALTLVVSSLSIFLALRLATYVIQFEDVLLGSHAGSLMKFLKTRLAPRKAISSARNP